MSAIVLKNANVITMDPSQPTAEMVAIRGNRILLVGNNSEQSVVGSKTKIIDCLGKTIVPGFIDAHCHIHGLVREMLAINLASVQSVNDIKALISQRVQSTCPGSWIIGTNYDEFRLAEKRHPTRFDIDKVSREHPVVLLHRSLHACALNSLALQLAGITSESPEPPGGLIDRDITGEPNGILFNMVSHILEKIPLPPADEMTKAIASANYQYLSHGVTSLQDASPRNNMSRWQEFRRLKGNGELESRVYMMFGTKELAQFQKENLFYGSGDNDLRLGGIKIILNEATQLAPSQEELNEQVLDIHKAGFPVAIHAIKPNTVEAAIIALEYARRHFSQWNGRDRIEHCSECPPDLLERIRKLQTIIVTQPSFLYCSGDRYLAKLSESRLQYLYRIKSFHDASLVVAASSDSPVTPVNPLIGIFAAVTRQAKTGQAVTPEESISPIQALAMYNIKGAYASFEEDVKGSISEGKLADMVMLSDNLLKPPPERIKDIKVEMTIIDGKIVWER